MQEVKQTYDLPNGEQHGLINQLANSVPDKNFSNFKEADREQMKKLKAKDAKLVKARDVNSRGGVEQMCKPYMHFAGENIQMWRCIHNHVYLVPQGLVDEVNGNPGLAKRSDILDVQGNPTKMDGSAEQIHRFYSAEF